METHVKNVVREMTRSSDEERIAFPEVVKSLMEAGIERYHADLIVHTKTYYTPEGDFEVVPCREGGAVAQRFDALAIQKAIRGAQTQEIKYREFCARIAAAGCVGYFVTMTGRCAVYYGRDMETHVELFPGAKP